MNRYSSGKLCNTHHVTLMIVLSSIIIHFHSTILSKGLKWNTKCEKFAVLRRNETVIKLFIVNDEVSAWAWVRIQILNEFLILLISEIIVLSKFSKRHYQIVFYSSIVLVPKSILSNVFETVGSHGFLFQILIKNGFRNLNPKFKPNIPLHVLYSLVEFTRFLFLIFLDFCPTHQPFSFGLLVTFKVSTMQHTGFVWTTFKN